MSAFPIAPDEIGHLASKDDWNETIAIQLAQTEGLILSTEHWLILYFLRDFYQNYGSIPTLRMIVRQMAKLFSQEKANSLYLQTLFPNKVLQQAAKIAGLPRPMCGI